MSAAKAGGSLSGLTVLVVEDEFVVAAMLADVLEDAGARVIGPAGNLTDGLRLAAEGRLDLAVLDWNLDGVCSEPIASALADAGVPFLIATGYGAIEGRFAKVPNLAKPFDPARLVGALRSLA